MCYKRLGGQVVVLSLVVCCSLEIGQSPGVPRLVPRLIEVSGRKVVSQHIRNLVLEDKTKK